MTFQMGTKPTELIRGRAVEELARGNLVSLRRGVVVIRFANADMVWVLALSIVLFTSEAYAQQGHGRLGATLGNTVNVRELRKA